MDEPEVAEIVLFARAHPRLLVRAIHVIVPAKVEDPVREQMGEFRVQRVAGFVRLPHGSGQRNGDVTEQLLFGHALHEIVGLIREESTSVGSSMPRN